MKASSKNCRETAFDVKQGLSIYVLNDMFNPFRNSTTRLSLFLNSKGFELKAFRKGLKNLKE